MTFTLPAAHHDFDVDPDTDPRQLVNIGPPTAVQTKAAGNLPITDVASQWRNNAAPGGVEGVGWEFQASQAAYDVSSDTYLMLWHLQFNAPNRIQVGTLAQGGVRVRLYSGTGSMPSDYREFFIGGSDTPFAECIKGHYPFVIDLNDSSEDAEVGTFDNTDVTSYAIVTETQDMAGTNDNWCYCSALYLIRTTKSSADTPTFTGASSFQDAVDLVQGSDYTDKLGNWVRSKGDSIYIDMPFRIGDNSTSTQFDDEGKIIISPPANDPNDPRVRVTTDAFRTYLNLRNNAADTALFSGTYIWGVRSDFDWDQDDAAVVTFSNPTFRGMGRFTLGSSITGPATWDDVDPVVFADTGVDVDGSTFRNPNGDHALELTAGAMDIANMSFSGYAGKHAILIDTAGTYEFDGVTFDGSGTADVENTSGGLVTINVVGGGDVPTVTNTGGGSTTTVNNNKTHDITVVFQGTAPANYEWRLMDDSGVAGEIGTTELDGAESETSLTLQYVDNYVSDNDVVLVIIADGFVESQTYFTLGNADSTRTVTIQSDDNI